jgi:hypothetical protein
VCGTVPRTDGTISSVDEAIPSVDEAIPSVDEMAPSRAAVVLGLSAAVPHHPNPPAFGNGL